MKHMRRIASLLLVLLMVFAMTSTAFATQTEQKGSITINDAIVGQTYSIYRMMDLESYDTVKKAYAYKANSDWEEFLNDTDILGTYVAIDAQGYVTWVEGASAATFAELALEYAEDEDIGPSAEAVTATTTTVEFSNLELGYYLLDTSLGTLCALNTTDPNVEMEEKNEQPTIEKKVQEDSNETWNTENTAQIGDTVNFQSTIHAKPGAQNYVMHDVMAGLTLDNTSIVVKNGTTTLRAGTDYTVSYNVAHEDDVTCSFDIEFKNTFLSTITANTDLVVTYSAVLGAEALIDEPNTNTTRLEYGDESFTTEWTDNTQTKTLKFDIVKTDGDNKLLSGATFKLYDAQTEGNEIKLVLDGDVYRIATEEEQEAGADAIITATGGKATVVGVDANTIYWLEEVAAPDGYNKLSGRSSVPIESSSMVTTMTGDTWTESDGGVHITNNAGTELPSTGGMGTTMLYVTGAIMVFAAFVTLITKKRMSAA